MKNIAIIGNTIESKLAYLLLKKNQPSWHITILTNNQPFQNHFHTGLEKPVTGLALIKLLRRVDINIQEYLNTTDTTFALALEYLNVIDKPLYRMSEPNIGSTENLVFDYMLNIVGDNLRNTENQNQPTITYLGDLAKIPNKSLADVLKSYCHYLIDNDLDLLENLFLFDPLADNFPHFDTDTDDHNLNGLELIQRLSNQFIPGKTKTNLYESIDYFIWNHDIEGLNLLLNSKIPQEIFNTDTLTDITLSTESAGDNYLGSSGQITKITINGQEIDFVIDTIGNNESLLSLLPPFVDTGNICNRIFAGQSELENFNKNKFIISIENDGVTFLDHKKSNKKNIFFKKDTVLLDLPYKDISKIRPKTIISNFVSNDTSSSNLPHSNYLLFSLEKFALEPFSFSDINVLTTMAASIPSILTEYLIDLTPYGDIVLTNLQYQYDKFLTEISNICEEIFQDVSGNFFQKYQNSTDNWGNTLPDLIVKDVKQNNVSTFIVRTENLNGDYITNAWDYLLIRHQKNKIAKTNLALHMFSKAYNYEKERKKYLFQTPLSFIDFRKLFLG